MSRQKRRTAVNISGKTGESKAPSGKPSGCTAEKPSVAWQNKDVTAKYFGENLKGKSFAVYGLELPDIKEVQPTNLPAIEANELRLDNLFLLQDDSLALVDYESSYADANKIKYLNYIVRTLKRNMEQYNFPCKIRMIVIYTADIEPQQTEGKLDIGCLQLQLEEAFLIRKDSEKTEARLQARFLEKQVLTDEEQMEFIILPLTYKGTDKKQACIRRCFEMAKLLEDEDMQRFLLSGMLVFADKVITKEDSKQIKEWIMMTKVGQLFEEEKIQYGREIEERVTRDVTKSVTRKVTKKNELKFTKEMLHAGLSIEEVSNMMTVLTVDDVRKIAESLNHNTNAEAVLPK